MLDHPSARLAELRIEIVDQAHPSQTGLDLHQVQLPVPVLVEVVKGILQRVFHCVNVCSRCGKSIVSKFVNLN
jgi:hypothetical protein